MQNPSLLICYVNIHVRQKQCGVYNPDNTSPCILEFNFRATGSTCAVSMKTTRVRGLFLSTIFPILIYPTRSGRLFNSGGNTFISHLGADSYSLTQDLRFFVSIDTSIDFQSHMIDAVPFLRSNDHRLPLDGDRAPGKFLGMLKMDPGLDQLLRPIVTVGTVF